MTVYRSPIGDVELRDISITERVFEGLVQRPDEVVLIDGPTGRRITARALMDAIRSLAGGLAARGFGAGATVAVMAPNVPEFATILHAVAWAGGTITTVNPTYTAPELHHQLTASGATLLVTSPQMMETAVAGAEGTRVTTIVVMGEAEGRSRSRRSWARRSRTRCPSTSTRMSFCCPIPRGRPGCRRA